MKKNNVLALIKSQNNLYECSVFLQEGKAGSFVGVNWALEWDTLQK